MEIEGRAIVVSGGGSGIGRAAVLALAGRGAKVIVADLDEPFADPSSVPTWYLARETTRHVKVVLGGDGGDEMFGGYKRYAKHLRTRWRRASVRGWRRKLRRSRTTGGCPRRGAAPISPRCSRSIASTTCPTTSCARPT